MGAQLPRDNKTYTTTQEALPQPGGVFFCPGIEHLFYATLYITLYNCAKAYTIPLRDSPVRPRGYRVHGIA